MKTSSYATMALLGTVLLWSFMVVVAKGIVAVVDPITVLFFRLLVAALCFLPFFIKNHTWTKPHFNKLVIISLGATVNLTFFILGIKHTTASASQIIYSAMPILVLIIGIYFKKERQSLKKITGVIIGFIGLLLIGFLSSVEKGETITGSLVGNLLIMIAMLGWTSYLLYSKSLSEHFQPIEMGSTSILVSFLVSAMLFAINQSVSSASMIIDLPLVSAALFMGFAGTFLTYILYQYAIHHSSTLKVSMTSYIQPITTAFLAILFIGEKLTFHFLLGSILVLVGVFLSSSASINLAKKVLFFRE